MGVLSGSHEIVELEEQHVSESKIIANAGKQHMGSLLKKYSIEDDINKLFEAIEIGSSRRVVGKPEKRVKDDFSRSAMKRPMRFGSGIGISEPVSLKQALRGLCISQASEMAAVKKRMSRLSASPGVLESVAIKKLYKGLATEAGQYKGNLVEILLIPEKRSSEFSDKRPEFGHLLTPEITQDDNMTEPKTEGDISPFQSSVGCELSEAESEQSKNLELVHSSSSAAFDQKFPMLDAISPGMDENPSIFNVERKLTKTSTVDFSSSKPSLRRQNIMKKKIVQKATAAKSKSQHNKGADSVHQYHTSKLVQQTPDSIKECEESEKVSPAASRTRKMAMTIAYERSRSNEQGGISQSSQSSIGEYISTTSYSEESYLSASSRSGYRPHMSSDLRWEAMTCVQKRHGSLSLRHFKLLRKLGGGDIGTVYLSELIGTSCLFAVKVMNNDVLVGKKKMLRAQTEKEILEILDHPFLPTLYAHFARNKFSCLVMEYCPGGDLHVLRQKQPTKCFSEPAARFYVAEVVVALEYLHMMGVVYRDLKPENVLVREDGHIMLSDFDLSLRCSTNPTLLKSPSPLPHTPDKISSPGSEPSCTDPFCLQPSWNLPCFSPTASNFKTQKLKSEKVIHLPQLLVEPTSARSNSFVGTHEYLAPEIIKGEGHGSAVDWWMLGIFLYELLYGKTPFKGLANKDTISNVVSQCLNFPECSMVSSEGRDLIGRLLSKEPENRLGSVKGAVEIKQHPFFDGLNWALIRCETPPELPKFFDLANVVIPDATCRGKANEEDTEFTWGGDGMEFEIF